MNIFFKSWVRYKIHPVDVETMITIFHVFTAISLCLSFPALFLKANITSAAFNKVHYKRYTREWEILSKCFNLCGRQRFVFATKERKRKKKGWPKRDHLISGCNLILSHLAIFSIIMWKLLRVTQSLVNPKKFLRVSWFVRPCGKSRENFKKTQISLKKTRLVSLNDDH